MRRIRNRAFEILCVLISLALVALLANALVVYVRNQAQHTQNNILKNVLTANGILQDEITLKDKHIVDLAKQYALALIDYSVESEQIKPVAATVFTSLYTAIPSGVEVLSLRFEDGYLLLSCKTQDEQAYRRFSENLTENFTVVSVSEAVFQDNSTAFSVKIKI